MFASYRTRVYTPGLDPTQIAAAKFMSGGRSCDMGARITPTVPEDALARRPLLGLRHKERTVARIWVETDEGNAVVGAPAAGSPYTDFLLTAVVEKRVEKAQIVETFGTPHVLFFGEKPQIDQFQGLLLNARNFQWRTRFWSMYDRYLRGTRCVETRATVHIVWDDIHVQGYMLNAVAQESAERPFEVPFAFAFLISNWWSISAVNTQTYPEEYLRTREGEVRDRVSRQWIILSPAMRAWVKSGGIHKLQSMLETLGVGGLDSEGARIAFDAIANPVGTGVAQAQQRVDNSYLRTGSRIATRSVGALDRVTGGAVGGAVGWLSKNTACLNAGWSQLMYGSGSIIGTALEVPALTTSGVRKLSGGEQTRGEGLDDIGQVTYSLEKFPDLDTTQRAGATTVETTESAWDLGAE